MRQRQRLTQLTVNVCEFSCKRLWGEGEIKLETKFYLVKDGLETAQLDIGVQGVDHLLLVHLLHGLCRLSDASLHLLQASSQLDPAGRFSVLTAFLRSSFIIQKEIKKAIVNFGFLSYFSEDQFKGKYIQPKYLTVHNKYFYLEVVILP